MNQRKIKEISKRMRWALTALIFSLVSFLESQVNLVYAEGNASSGSQTEIRDSILRITNISVTIISAVGIVVALYGVFEYATAWGQHDSAQQTAAIKKIVAGLIMIFAGSIASYITQKDYYSSDAAV